MTERIRCNGYERDVDQEVLNYYRVHYGDKNDSYCRSNRGHVIKKLSYGVTWPNVNLTRLAELHAINERLAALQREKQGK